MICWLCEKDVKNVKNERHHMIPGFMTRMKEFEKWKSSGGTIVLCPDCHKKLHFLLEPIELVLKKKLSE